MKELEQMIEQKRVVLHLFAKVYGIKDQRTVNKSIELDKLLNTYWRRKVHQQNGPTA
ncbi:aspartyl-phosphate phosphatase Spo0E family protein [Paenibacillus zanthoxyli]|uniref:aspartyl-phosphate phosphatase Spo0E family protein n=1 Tax=Paenibacillus zanthoxyli TaxID=369399 RepID=UPI0004ACC600|nr:aspartyl-phosphate phosphatase Spo0E family protein [Paenibacillus zanthoxyli]